MTMNAFAIGSCQSPRQCKPNEAEYQKRQKLESIKYFILHIYNEMKAWRAPRIRTHTLARPHDDTYIAFDWPMCAM